MDDKSIEILRSRIEIWILRSKKNVFWLFYLVSLIFRYFQVFSCILSFISFDFFFFTCMVYIHFSTSFHSTLLYQRTFLPQIPFHLCTFACQCQQHFPHWHTYHALTHAAIHSCWQIPLNEFIVASDSVIHPFIRHGFRLIHKCAILTKRRTLQSCNPTFLLRMLELSVRNVVIVLLIGFSTFPVHCDHLFIDLNPNASNYRELPRFWTNSGFSPSAPLPFNRTSVANELQSNDVYRNIDYVSAMPNMAIKHIRIHWVLSLVEFK